MSQPDPDMNHDMKDFRQPMVTSLGIILGFMLNFLGQWAIQDDGEIAVTTKADMVVAVGLIVAIAMMLWVLFRLLNNRYPLAQAGHYYHATFRAYMLAILLAFGAVTAALFV